MKDTVLRASWRDPVSDVLAIERGLEIINGEMLAVGSGKFFGINRQAFGHIHRIADVEAAVVGAGIRF